MIELVEDDGPHDGQDVAFGVGQRRDRPSASGRGPRVKIAAGVIGVLALGGAAMAFSRDDAPTGEQTSATTVPDPINSTNFPQATTPAFSLPTGFDPIEPNPLPTLATTTTLFDSGAGQVLPTDSPLGLYVATGNNSDGVLRLDLATGTVAEVEGQSSGRVRAVLSGPDGPIFVDDSVVSPDAWITVVSPDGTVWAPDTNGTGIIQFDSAGKRLRTVSAPFSSIFGNTLVGVTADGRPVVIGADARAYTVNPDDTYARIGDGFVFGVQPGGYWETICDLAAVCQTIIHGVGQPPFAVDVAETNRPFGVSLSPSGRFAVVVFSGAASIIDLAAGLQTEVPTPGPINEGFDFFGQQRAGLWFGTGDQFLIVSSTNHLVVYDTTTGQSRTIDLPPGSYNRVLLGFAP